MKQLQFEQIFSRDPFFNIAQIRSTARPDSPRIYDPHSHDYYVIMIITQGQGVHNIDFKQYPINAPSIFFLSPNQVHQVIEESAHKGYTIAFNEEFLLRSNISRRFFENINLFHPYGESPPLLPGSKTMEVLENYCRDMERCFQEKSEFKYQALGSLLRLFLIECNGICELAIANVNQTLDSAMSTISAFKNMVEAKISQWHKASQYAEALHITPNYLNKLNREYLNTSTKEYLQNRLVLAAKRRLLTSGDPVKEIAFDLGFQDPSHLSKMFRNCTGESITSFRNSIRE